MRSFESCENESVLNGFEKEAKLILKKDKKCEACQKLFDLRLKHMKWKRVCRFSNLSCVSVSLGVLIHKNCLNIL